ncbi:MAG: protein kinase domain-containing protein, partial [Planctomycetota bacterium]
SRFKHEARALASINHPNIATIYEVLDEDPQRHVLILEYVPGKTLAELIGKRPLKLKEALNIASQTAEAVAAAHEQGVIHRDLKPGNIKITPDGKVKVLDFGLAKAVEGQALDEQSTLTVPGRIVGTPAYMSPEQARGKEVDKRTDVWSFGCCLFEMLTANRPFRGETMTDLISAVLNDEPNWSLLSPETPREVTALLRRCLEKEHQRRLRDMGDIGITLEETIHTGPAVLKGPRPVRTLQTRYPWISRFWPVAVGLLLGLIVASIGLLRPATPRVRPDQIRSLAVLPFEASGSEPNLSQFAMWIPDDISVALQKLKVFDRVPPWSLAKTLADSSPIQASRQLNVQGLVQGRIRMESGEININLELIDGPSSTRVWADTFQTEGRDIEGLKRRMVLTLLRDGLRRTLTADERARLGTPKKINTEAYAAYRRGLESMFTITQEGVAKAIAEFERAQRLDPQFIDPLALLANLEWWQTWMTKTPMTHREGLDRAKARLAMALRQAPNNGAVLWAQGILAMLGDWDWKLAKTSFRKAITVDASTADYYEGLALYASRVEGRYADAIDYITKGLELHPDSPPVLNIEPTMYQHHGFYERALELHESCRTQNPTHPFHLADIAVCHAELGRFKEALEAAREAVDVSDELPHTLSSLACICAQSGDLAGARSILKRLEEQAQTIYVAPHLFAQIYAWLGEWDDAFNWLDSGYEQGAVMGYLGLRSHRYLTLMGDQPRYWDIVDRMKFPALPIEHPFHEKEQQMRFGKTPAHGTGTSSIVLPDEAPLALSQKVQSGVAGVRTSLTLPLNGKELACVAWVDDRTQLYRRSLDEATAFVYAPLRGIYVGECQ